MNAVNGSVPACQFTWPHCLKTRAYAQRPPGAADRMHTCSMNYSTTVERQALDTVPVAEDRSSDQPLLMLRLSDGRTWAHEFGASGHHDLRNGCFEAWVACRMEWQRRAPARQWFKRSRPATPAALELDVLDTSARHVWVNASHGTVSAGTTIVPCPGPATHAQEWEGPPWDVYWERCLRTWSKCAETTRFLNSVAHDFGIEVRRAAELARIKRRL